GLSNQVFFLLSIILFGGSSGSAIFTAQYWGRKDVANIRKVLGIGLALALAVSFVFTIAVLFIPQKVLSFYTNDAAVIELGAEYLRIVGLSYVLTAISYTYMSVLRSTEHVKLPTAVSVLALSMNMLLNYALIFGNFGFPALGVRGAAIGTTLSRSIECLAMVYLAYRLKTPVAARIKELFSFDWAFFRKTLQTSLPALLNEGVWAFGVTTYNSIYAHIGTEAIAAVNINSTIESMAFVVFIGSANASAIMIGNQIGLGHEDKAFDYGRRFIALGIVGAVLVGGVLIFLRGPLLSLYNISAESYNYSNRLLLFFSLTLWVRVTNMTTFIGVLRSGGDTRFCLITETIAVWLVGVPAAFIGANVFHLPVYYVYLLAALEEVTKLIVISPRFLSKRWINNLTEQAAEV
ncbi:MAG: MATE family efflux transporter, partial [Anaerolineaceae bacterium]|nr:MATE family efflux transporter [Anaerolineaceae bacterium]